MKFKTGDKVEVNGNKEATILNHYFENMYNVRLWSNFRHIGDVCVDESQIKLIKEESTTIETWSTSNIKTLIRKIKDQVVNKKMDSDVSDILIRHFENVIQERNNNG